MPNKFVENIECSDASMYSVTTDHAPYYIPDNTRPMDGVVRTNQGGLEYYDANSGDWFPLPGCEVKLELGPIEKTVLDWAYFKMQEEAKLDELVKKYPSFKEVKQNYDIIKAMVENELA